MEIIDKPPEIPKNSKSESKWPNRNRCVYCCVNRMQYPERRFFKFPKDPERCLAWARACKKPYILAKTVEQLQASYKLCSEHFVPSDYATCKMMRLKLSACPSIFNSEPQPRKISFPSIKSALQRKMEEAKSSVNMPTNSLAIPLHTSTPKSNSTELTGSPGNEKLSRTDWPYFQRVQLILNRMKTYQDARATAIELSKSEGSNSVKPKNQPHKIYFIATKTNNVCVNEADVNTILKAMNGEDITSKQEESSSAMEVAETSEPQENEPPDSNYGDNNDDEEEEEEDDESRSNDAMSETSTHNKSDSGNTLQNHEESDQCTTSTLAIKEKDDNQQLQPRIERTFSISKESVQKTDESKTCNCTKDEVDLYTALLSTKLKNMDEKSRHIAMNKIDNILFKMKMELFESQ